MKIIYITHYTELYGANKSLLNLLSGLSSYDIDIHLVVPATGKITEIAAAKNIPYTVIPFYNEIHVREKGNAGSITKIKETGKGVIKFLYNCYVVLKHASFFKDCDIIHVNSSATFIGAYFAWRMKKPLVWHIREFGWADYRIKYNFGYAYFQYWLNKAVAIIGISKAIYDERVATARPRYKELIYNGIISYQALQHNKAEVLRMLDTVQTNAVFTFAIVGHINSEKNQMEALQAFHLLQQRSDKVRLMIVGTGADAYVQQLIDFTRAHHLEDRVTFTGFIEDIEAVYSSASCLLMCSKNEALGRVTIEAMSHGIPVIGFNAAGTKEIITDGYNGFLYDQGYRELAEKMLSLVDNESRYASLIKNALNTVEKYTIEQCSASVYNLYLKCIKTAQG